MTLPPLALVVLTSWTHQMCNETSTALPAVAVAMVVWKVLLGVAVRLGGLNLRNSEVETTKICESQKVQCIPTYSNTFNSQQRLEHCNTSYKS